MNKRILFSVLIAGLLVSLLIQGNSFAQTPQKILSIEAYDMLNTVPDTYLIDVRTRSEYQFVGHPVGAYLFPYMLMTTNFKQENNQHGYDFSAGNPDFIKEINKLFQKSNNLLIISRDGIRSALAAKALVNAGFKNIYNVEDGFEGVAFPSFKDSNKHKFYRQLARRNKVYGFNLRRHYGWQWWGLPWTYRIDSKYIYPPDNLPAQIK